MQVTKLFAEADSLHKLYGDKTLCSIYGAGCIEKPKAMFVFMNPTAKNISACKSWKGLRAPWLGTKNIWGLFRQLGIISEDYFRKTQSLKLEEWMPEFCEELYKHLEGNGVYVTNLAKCTQLDARPLKDNVFREYLDLMEKEIVLIKPQNIITFGNQVSSIVLNKKVSVSKYTNCEEEYIDVHGTFYKVYPAYYPVGHGRMNQHLAVKRIKAIFLKAQ